MTDYKTLYAWRKDGKPFTGSIFNTDVFFESPVESNDPSVLQPHNAYTLQQNINADGHWFQNTVWMLAGKPYWHLEGFTAPYSTGKGGQFFRTSPDQLPPLPPIDLSTGRYVVLLSTWDTGTDIRAQVMILDSETDNYDIVYQPDWVSFPFYGPLYTATMSIVGFSSSTATFTKGRFFVKHSAEAPLALGGQSLDLPPIVDEIPHLDVATNEFSNLRLQIVNPNPMQPQLRYLV